MLSRRLVLLALLGALGGTLAGARDAVAKSGGGGKGGDGGGDGGDGDGGGGDDGGGDDRGGDDNDGDRDGGRKKSIDHKHAKDAVKHGDARPLQEILKAVAKRYPGRVVDVRLKRRSKVLMYDIKLITPTGKLIKVRVDAASGTILGKDD